MKSNHNPDFEVVLSHEALDDLSSIQQYTYEMFGENQLHQYEKMLMNTFQLMQENPEIGRIHHKRFDDSLRAIVSGQHTIFYRIKTNTIRVVRILHQRMDIKGFE